MHISGRKRETEAVAGVLERNKRRECQSYWRERCASQVLAGRSLPGMATTTNLWLRCRTEVSSSHEITWSGLANGSAPFNSEAVAVGMG
jgi:hypothetical protein